MTVTFAVAIAVMILSIRATKNSEDRVLSERKTLRRFKRDRKNRNSSRVIVSSRSNNCTDI